MSEVESQLEAYLARYVGGKSRRQVAELAGINKDTWNRAMNLGRMQAESAIRFARAFNVQVVPFLRDLGFLTEDEVVASVARLTLEELSDVELARELLRRVESSTLALPLDEQHPAIVGSNHRGALSDPRSRGTGDLGTDSMSDSKPVRPLVEFHDMSDSGIAIAEYMTEEDEEGFDALLMGKVATPSDIRAQVAAVRKQRAGAQADKEVKRAVD